MWDPKASKTISAERQMSAIDYNVFEGFRCEGLPRVVLLRGTVVLKDGVVTVEPGQGRFLPRAPFPAAAKALTALKRGTAPGKVAR